MGDVLSGPKIDTSASSSLINKGVKAAKDLKPISLNAGGLSGSYNKGTNTYGVTADANRKSLVQQLSGQYTNQADQLAGLKAQFAPGYSALRQAQLQDLANQQQSATGNLQENLARRRVLGSSFANDALQRQMIDFSQQRSSVIAQTYLQELDATNQIINQESTARQNAVQAGIGELNLEASLGQGLIAQASDVLKSSAQLQAQVAASGAATMGSIASNQAQLDAGAQSGLGKLLGTGLGLLTGGASSLIPGGAVNYASALAGGSGGWDTTMSAG